MLLRVHNGLAFATPEAEAERAIVVIKRTMEGAAEPAVVLTVPMVVDARAAGNWDEAHWGDDHPKRNHATPTSAAASRILSGLALSPETLACQDALSI